MVSFPPCKINLGLRVVSKRSDGFHNIETCFVPVKRTDILEIIPSNKFSISFSGINIPGSNENSCAKAFHLLAQDFTLAPVKIHLHKIIPIGAGLGGGSADAAFTLQLLKTIFELTIAPEKLKEYAAQLGSDCPFFLSNTPQMATGRGEILSPALVDLKNYFLVLITPRVHSSTADAYAQIIPRQPEISLADILRQPIGEWKNKLVNDFEESFLKKYPIIGQVKEKLYAQGALYSSMSGSGSTVFGIFEKPVNLEKEFCEMDYWSGALQ